MCRTDRHTDGHTDRLTPRAPVGANYQIQNFQNEQIVLDELNEAQADQTVENSGDILNTHQSEEDSVIANNNNANVDQTVDADQVGSQNNEALIEEFNQNIPLEEEDDDEILYSDPFEHLPYYHGEISREVAEARLKNMLRGTFLTRY